MPLPIDPIKRELYLANLRERFAAYSILCAEKRREMEGHLISKWITEAPLCRCGCGSKVQVNIDTGLKNRCKNYTYREYLPGHNGRTIDQGLILSYDEEQLILGSLLGDASLSYAHKTAAAPRLIMNHGYKQYDYVSYKAEELSRLGAQVKITKNKGFGTLNATLKTPTLECLIPIHNLMYCPKKVVTRNLLDKLNFKAWAFWWLDDGSLSKTSYSGTLSTCSFSEEEHKLIKEYFYSFGIATEILFSKYYYIKFNKQGIIKLLDYINPHIPIGIMDYKFELVDPTSRAGILRHDNHPRAKLNSKLVSEIRSNTIDCAKTLAEKYSVSVNTIYDVKKGKTWRDING